MMNGLLRKFKLNIFAAHVAICHTLMLTVTEVDKLASSLAANMWSSLSSRLVLFNSCTVNKCTLAGNSLLNPLTCVNTINT